MQMSRPVTKTFVGYVLLDKYNVIYVIAINNMVVLRPLYSTDKIIKHNNASTSLQRAMNFQRLELECEKGEPLSLLIISQLVTVTWIFSRT